MLRNGYVAFFPLFYRLNIFGQLGILLLYLAGLEAAANQEFSSYPRRNGWATDPLCNCHQRG